MVIAVKVCINKLTVGLAAVLLVLIVMAVMLEEEIQKPGLWVTA